MSLSKGARFGSYEITGQIGAGGMGEVYQAHDSSLGRNVAIKVLPESLTSDANRSARFDQEAKTLAALNHPNIAQIYGLERNEGVTALAMELIEGPTLADRITQGPIPAEEALGIAVQIADALEAAHERAIVHRDLKPANIKLTPSGLVKVLDFGIAKALDTRVTSSGNQAPVLTTPSMTEAGMVLGTAAYMSPEQARGRPLDQRADIWAFGCVLYEMLTGQPAFLGDDVTTTLARVLEREPDMRPLPAGLPPAVRQTLELCFEKDARKRIADIRDVKLAMQGGFTSTAPGEAAPGQPLWRLALPVAGALVVGALLASAYMANRAQPEAPDTPELVLPVVRFTITPPAETPLASLGGYDVAISPDGTRLAYFAANPEQNGVSMYVRDLDSLESRRVIGADVPNPSGGNMNPFFSPDGNSVGLFVPERGVISVPVDGGPATKLIDTPASVFLGAAWSDDETLIFSAGPILERARAADVPTQLTEPVGDGFVMSPVPLPGGRAVLYGRLTNGVESIEVLDLETGETKTLIENGQNATYASTGHIVFARGNTLMAAPFSASELSLLGEPVAVLPGVRHPNPTTAADFALSGSGTLVYVPAGAEAATRAAVVWVDRQGNVIARAVQELVENPRDPRLSPDGTRLVLTTGALANGGIWSYDLRGRPPIPIAIGNIDYRLPLWSPDGTEITFVALGTTQTLIAPADGSVLTPRPLERAGGRIAAPGEWGVPEAWSPAGDLIYQRSAAGPDIMVNTAAGDIRELVASEFSEFDASLSPNGRWLAYASNRTGQFEVWVRPYPEGAPVRISSTSGIEPRWSADGTELFYQLVAQGGLMAVPVETEGEFSFGTPVELFDGPYRQDFTSLTRSYDVASDGRFLMIQSEDTGAGAAESSSVVVVQNWTEELKRRVQPGGN